MPRKQHPEEHSNHERWLVSYADFITLLFAFFVMMYANSQTDRVKAQRISEAFRHALDEGRISQTLAKLLGNQPAARKTPDPEMFVVVETPSRPSSGVIELLPSLKQLNESLKLEIESGRVEVRMERRGLVISLKEATFFPSVGDTIEPSTLPNNGKDGMPNSRQVVLPTIR